MIKKTIQINPELFTIGSKKKKDKKKGRKLNPFSAALKPNDVKKQLINRVKEAQKRKKEKLMFERNKQNKDKDESFANDFTNTVNYLETVEKEKQKKRRKKRERKKKNKTMKAAENAINNILKPAPEYGILKNSKKPTYRQWKKTLKNREEDVPSKINISDDIERKPDKNDRQNKLDELKQSFDKIVSVIEPGEKTEITSETEIIEKKKKKRKKSFNKIVTKKEPEKKKKIKNKKKIIEKKKKKRRKHKTKKIKRKLTLGKNLKKGVVSVLIKNRTMRKKIKAENLKLHTKSDTVVRRYLLKHNLMKIGSSAPDDILRTTYENSYLTGDVINKNADVLLHNYIQEA